LQAIVGADAVRAAQFRIGDVSVQSSYGENCTALHWLASRLAKTVTGTVSWPAGEGGVAVL